MVILVLSPCVPGSLFCQRLTQSRLDNTIDANFLRDRGVGVVPLYMNRHQRKRDTLMLLHRHMPPIVEFNANMGAFF